MNQGQPIDDLNEVIDDLSEAVIDDLDSALVVDDLSAAHKTREDWLTSAVNSLRPMFESANIPLAENIRVACGFPSTATRSGTVSEIWADTASRDGTKEILISPVLDDPAEVLAALISRLCAAHPSVGSLRNGPDYAAAARLMGLEPLRTDWKSSRGNADFKIVYGELLGQLGIYPHAALVPGGGRKKQTTRMLKGECAECGYTIRLTQKWASKGLPSCCCGGGFRLASE